MFDITSLLIAGFGAGSLMLAYANYAIAYRKSLKVKPAGPEVEE